MANNHLGRLLLLPLPPKSWDYSDVPPDPVYMLLWIKVQAFCTQGKHSASWATVPLWRMFLPRGALFLSPSTDSPECRILKTHHCHQALHLFPFSCNTSWDVVGKWGKTNNTKNQEGISHYSSLANESINLHVFSSNWHHLLHHWVICCDLNKDISEQNMHNNGTQMTSCFLWMCNWLVWIWC